MTELQTRTKYTYDSFGKLTASSGSIVNRFQYTGRDFDSETGIFYYRSRYYDSMSGRFLSEDPIGFDGDGVDFYAYVENNVTGSVDPFGLQHAPGGPWHPPAGTKLRCNSSDPCPVLLDKIETIAHMLASHYIWDWVHGTNRHQSDLDNLWGAYGRCIDIYIKKCENCPDQGPQPAPNPSPNPNPTPVPVPIPFVPTPGMPPITFPELPIPLPTPFPEPIPVPL